MNDSNYVKNLLLGYNCLSCQFFEHEMIIPDFKQILIDNLAISIKFGCLKRNKESFFDLNDTDLTLCKDFRIRDKNE